MIGNSSTFYAFVTLCILFLVYAGSHISKARRLYTFHEIEQLLNPKGSGNCVSVESLLLARSSANARLKNAFGIRNTFVDPSLRLHHDFVGKAVTLLDTDWYSFRDLVKDAVQGFECGGNQSNFAEFTQVITLKTILLFMFNVEPTLLRQDDLVIISRGINIRWRLSKTYFFQKLIYPAPRLRDINSILLRWIPDIENPLDFLIPSFETMWRAVAVSLANVSHEPELSRIMVEYFHCPSTLQYTSVDESLTINVESIVLETLRLYPPTKRITRFICPINFLKQPCYWMHSFGPFLLRREVADIEFVQRSDTWGAEVDKFRPVRHILLTRSGKKAPFLAFGLGPLKCIASSWAPRAIGLIVAGVLNQDGLRIIKGRSIGSRDGWEDWCVEYAEPQKARD